MKTFSAICLFTLLCAKTIAGDLPFMISQDQDTIPVPVQDFSYYDKLISKSDSLGNYDLALEWTNEALILAKKREAPEKEWQYHLKLAKYFYLLGRPDEAFAQLRLYSILKSTGIKSQKDQEILDMENAYLEEINDILLEMNQDKSLIENLQQENEKYYQVQLMIKNAVKIGLAALALIAVIVIYNRYRSGKNKEEQVKQDSSDLQRLRDHSDKVDVELSRNQQELAKLKEKLYSNLTFARSIQLSLLPSGIELTDTIANSFVLHLPRDIISGDFYSVHKNDNKTVIAVFDCPGHGVDAAHSTVVSFNIFNEITTQGITAPSMILTMMDQRLKHETQQLEPQDGMISGVKMAVCTVNNETKEMEYAGAHFPLFYVHLDELHFVRSNRFPVGDPLFSDKFYSSSNLRLSDGDMVYLCSDGYYNQLGGKKNKKFLRGSLVNLLNSVQSQEISEQQFILEKVFQEWKSHHEQTDDVLVLAFRI